MSTPHHLSARARRRRRSDRGASLVAMFAVVMVVLVMAIGLVVDGGAQTATKARAEAVAAEAARAGANAGAGSSLQGGDMSTSARLAAQRVLEARGMSGTIRIESGNISVDTHTSTSTTFLSLAGITELRARGSATARLVDS